MPDEEFSSHTGRHSSRHKGLSRKRGKITLNDEEGGSTGLENHASNITMTTRRPTTTAQSTVTKEMTSESEKRGKDSGTNDESLTTERPPSVAKTQQLTKSLVTEKPLLSTVSPSILKPSRSDSLKKSLLALEGAGSVKVCY